MKVLSCKSMTCVDDETDTWEAQRLNALVSTCTHVTKVHAHLEPLLLLLLRSSLRMSANVDALTR
jgi:hypothetical protein